MKKISARNQLKGKVVEVKKGQTTAYAGGDPPASFSALRLVVPGDAHGGRSVHDVSSIELR